MSEWKPIASAPKNMTVIGYAVKLPERWVRVGLGCIDSAAEWSWHQDVEWGDATHWMPLPASPSPEQEPGQ